MRNGNNATLRSPQSSSTSSYPTYEEWKHSWSPPSCLPIVGSYPTYEEWKPCQPVWVKQSLFSSYPTYEEWKLFQNCILPQGIYCSYPTYEEWKLMSVAQIRLHDVESVLILPMRNGNVYSLSLSFELFVVLILPMRNGNQIKQLIFLHHMNSSYPTYEEWKPGVSSIETKKSFQEFLSYL